MKLALVAFCVALFFSFTLAQEDPVEEENFFDYIWSTYWTSLSSATSFFQQNFSENEEYWRDVVIVDSGSNALVPVVSCAIAVTAMLF